MEWFASASPCRSSQTQTVYLFSFFLSHPVRMYSLCRKKTRLGAVTSPTGGAARDLLVRATLRFTWLDTERVAPPGKSPLWPESSALVRGPLHRLGNPHCGAFFPLSTESC